MGLVGPKNNWQDLPALAIDQIQTKKVLNIGITFIRPDRASQLSYIKLYVKTDKHLLFGLLSCFFGD